MPGYVSEPPFTPDPAGRFQDVVQADDTVVSTFFATDPEQGPRYDRTSYVSNLLATFKEVRLQLAADRPVAYNDTIILLDLYAAERRANPDELEGAALAVLSGTRHVRGGAIEKLRKLLGA
jgi:hypothetical protein